MTDHGPGPSRPAVVERLRAAGCVFAEDEARLLVEAAGTRAQLAELVRRRVDGVPLEVVLGWAEFCGLRIAVDAGVFVPRRRTELLAREALALARPGAVVVDLCCGTGALGAAVAALARGAEVHAGDLDNAAVRCAARNLPPERVHRGDLYAALPTRLRGRVDVLVVNAPYVPTDAITLMPPEAREHEPQAALDGGADGVKVHRRVAAGAPPWLSPSGSLLIETSEHQASLTAAAVAKAGLVPRVVSDPEHGSTAVLGSRAP